MAGFFSWLTSGAKFVATNEQGLAPIYATTAEHPKVGQWFPRSGSHEVPGGYRCTGCNALTGSRLIEAPRPAPGEGCRVLADELGLP